MIHTPTIHVAGRYALTETGNNISYTCYCHTLHIFDYAVRLTVNDTAYSLNRGDAALAIAETNVLYEAPSPTDHFVFHFDFDITAEPELISGFSIFRLGQSYQDMLQQCANIQKKFESANNWQQRSAEAGLYEVLCDLHANEAMDVPSKSKADRALHQAVEWIDAHLHLPFRVEDLAADVGLDHNYLARKFKEAYGKTIQTYSREQRLIRANHWLIQTDLPIKVIAADLGFFDTQHFYRCFKQHYATTPGTIRRAGK